MTSGIPFLNIQALAALASPPLHEPALPQLINACTEGITSFTLPFVPMRMRSAIDETVACPQQLRQVKIMNQ